ncbi:MAG TPA: class II fructose-bisphosphate aldolase [Armatimonadota bacterium]|nr:class II fructose-bisphosphate aldolase [Armatimonadota bacterium]
MKFCSSKELADKARVQGYAVPAFNSNGGTYDITRAIIEAAEELRSPMILQTYEPNCAYRGFEYCALQAAHLAKDAKIPIALHLDHGMSLESVMRAVKAGYTSVMIDASHLPIEENIRATREVIAAVRPLGVTVEAEVGHVAGGAHSHGQGNTTDPAEAVRFVEATGVDMLAVANGTEHGVFDLQDQIDLPLVRELRQKVSVPLVQHGTCGIPLGLVTDLVKAGMAKINFGEPFRANYIEYFKEFADTLDHKDHVWKIMEAVKDRLKEDMKAIIRALGSEGKAV